MSEDKLYRIKTKEGAHINEKIKDDGSRAALQFDDENGLQGPVDLIEVDDTEYVREVYIPERTMGQAFFEEVVAPVMVEVGTVVLEKAIDAGMNAFGNWMSQTVIPVAKSKKAELKNKVAESRKEKNAKKAEKKQTALAVKKKAEAKTLPPKTEDKTIVHTQEEVDQILNNMKFAALYIAAGIRELSNTAINDDGTDPEKALTMQKKLQELSSREIMDTIEFLLADENRDMLDQATIRLFEAFRHNDFIVEGEAVPISNYLVAAARAE